MQHCYLKMPVFVHMVSETYGLASPGDIIKNLQITAF